MTIHRQVGDVFRDPDSGILVRLVSVDPYQIEPIFVWSEQIDGIVNRMTPAGRPEIGPPINVRLGDDLLAAVDAKADRLGVSRAEVIRMILADALQSEM